MTSAGSARPAAGRTPAAISRHATPARRKNGERGRLWKREDLHGEERDAPAAALIAA